MKRLFVCMLLLLAFALPARADIPLVFDLPENISPSEVWVLFPQGYPVTGYYLDASGANQTLAMNTTYRLDTMVSPTSVGTTAPANKPALVITTMSGRIYLSVGSEIKPPSSGSAIPDASNNASENWNVRYQYIEPTIDTTSVNIDVSYIDFAAIPISLEMVNAAAVENNPQLITINTQTLYDRTRASASAPGNVTVPQVNGTTPTAANFARIVAPQLKPDAYHTWDNYIDDLKNETVHIKGFYVGTDPANTVDIAPQTYDYIVTFNSTGDATFAPQNGSGVSSNTTLGGVGSGNDTTIYISNSDLTSLVGIYGNNPAYSFPNGTKTLGLQNDIYGRVVGDLVAGMTFGFAGSDTMFNSTTKIGDMDSTQWFGGYVNSTYELPTATQPGILGYGYDIAQPGKPDNYHVYGASLEGVTAAYGSALADRLGNNLLSIKKLSENPDAYLKVIIDKDPNTLAMYSFSQEPGTVTKTTNSSVQKTSASQLSTTYALSNFEPLNPIAAFNATVNTADDNATFMIGTTAIHSGPLSDLKLYRLNTATKQTNEFTSYAANGSDFSAGNWWVTDSVGTYMAQNSTASAGKQYFVHFVIQDNGPLDDNTADKEISATAVFGIASGAKAETIDFAKGWNLKALPLTTSSTNVQTIFGDVYTKCDSIWKYTSGSWQVALPTLSSTDEQAYLTSKNFSKLETIQPGEGFWVNANQTVSLPVSGSEVTSPSLSASKGWNMMGWSGNTTLSLDTLNATLGTGIESVWKWNSTAWHVFLPAAADNGTQWAGQKGFGVMDGLEPGEGLWIHKP